MFNFKKKHIKHGNMIVQAGVGSIIYPLTFKPEVVSAGLVSTNRHYYPACQPLPTDIVKAEILSFDDGRYWAIQVSWNVAGTREIDWEAKNFYG